MIIDQLPSLVSVQDTDEVAIERGTTTYKTTVEKLSDEIAQTGGVQTALAGKQNTLTFDIAPTEDSANPVTSGGIYNSISSYVRPNLLDNWFFATSLFPVNQRGQSSYSGGTGYCVDRWVRRNDGGTVTGTATITDDGLRLSLASGKSNGLNQTIEHAALLNKTVTISALFSGVSTGSLLKLQLAAANESRYNSSEIGGVSVNGNGLFSVTFNMPSSIGNYSLVNFGFYCVDSNQFDGTLVAAKLELGSTQTLAHQENGTWVLNEIPNYAEELLKCQRYLVKFFPYQRKRADAVLGTAIDFLFPIPCTMASLPSIIGTPAVHLFGATETAQTGFTFSAPGQGGGYMQIRASKTSHGLTDATCYGTDSWFLSCEP